MAGTIVLTKEEISEIEHKIVMNLMRTESFRLSKEFVKRDLNNKAKQLDIPEEKLIAYMKKVVQDLVTETFGK